MLSKRNIALLLSGVLLGTGGAGGFVWANFTAQTRNPGNAFAAGTLVLSNTKVSGSTCYSSSAGSTDSNNNTSCAQLVAMSLKKPGDSATSRIIIKDEGSLDASALQVFAGSCAAADASGESYHGTADPCAKVQVYVQQYSDSSFTTKSSCLFGGGTATVCDFSDTTKTVGLLTTTYSSSSPLALGALTAGASDYLEIGFALASNADNTYQGRAATFDLTWQLSQ